MKSRRVEDSFSSSRIEVVLLLYLGIVRGTFGIHGYVLRQPVTRELVKGATAHEAGHAIEFIKNQEPLQPGFVGWVNSDLNYLDFTSPGVPRDACVDGTVTAPFKNVAAETGGFGFICAGGTGALNPAFIDPQTQQPYPNSTILRMIMVSPIFTPSQDLPAWTEPYAQAFAYEAFDKTIPNNEVFLFSYAGVASNGYLKCQTTWANAVLNNASTPPTPPTGFTCQ